MTNVRRLVFLSAALAVLAACATAGNERTRTNSSVITYEEIQNLTTASTLYDVVQQLRPRWLQVRGTRSVSGATGSTSIVVYQGQTQLGGPEVLRQFDPDAVYSLRYMDGPQASASLPGLGGRHIEGAILLITSPSGD